MCTRNTTMCKIAMQWNIIANVSFAEVKEDVVKNRACSL